MVRDVLAVRPPNRRARACRTHSCWIDCNLTSGAGSTSNSQGFSRTPREGTTMNADKTEIQGFCAPKFEDVRTEFQRNFEDRGEIGAAVSVCIEGKPVV